MTESLHLRNKRRVSGILNGITAANCEQQIRSLMARDVVWNGPHPINTQSGCDALMSNHYAPLFKSFPDLERRDDILLGGEWKQRDWVCATGHYVGTFAADWLGIPANGKQTRIRYGEFYRVEADHVAECYVLLDLLEVFDQVGVRLIPAQLGEKLVVPGPSTGDGLQLHDNPAAESDKSARLVHEMIDDLMRFDPLKRDYSAMQHAHCWHEDMRWYGPSGIGTTYGIDGFIDRHQRPFLTAFPDRKGGFAHGSRIADGHYVGSTGWPSVVATHSGVWLGVAPSNKRIGMRVMDFWRRDGDRFRENWVFIDMVDLLLQMGVDLFARIRTGAAS